MTALIVYCIFSYLICGGVCFSDDKVPRIVFWFAPFIFPMMIGATFNSFTTWLDNQNKQLNNDNNTPQNPNNHD